MILYECYADETLLSALGLQRKEIEHAGCIGNVGNRLKSKYKYSIGMIDEDPGKSCPSYINNCNFVNMSTTNVDVKVKYDNARKNYIVLICPDLEPWILKITNLENIDITSYGLSNDPDILHDELTVSEKKRNSFKQLIIDLEAKSNHIKTLKALLLQLNKP